MIRIAICDDEKTFIHRIYKSIEHYLKQNKMDFECSTFSSGEDFVLLKEKICDFDIVFLDVNMKELDGIEVGEIIRSYSEEIVIVFVTAFIKYAPAGYKCQAFRFILKEEGDMQEMIYECMDEFVKMKRLREQKRLYRFESLQAPIDLSKVLYIMSSGHNLYISTQDAIDEFSFRGRLDDLEEELSKYSFLRVHQSFLVNLSFAQSISNYKIYLKDGKDLPISKARFKKSKEAFIDYRGAW